MWLDIETTEEGEVFFVKVAFTENDADSGAEEEGEDCVSFEEAYELKLVRNKDKRVLACANAQHKVRHISGKDEYILWKVRTGRMVGGS
jgi:hypothetical protein